VWTILFCEFVAVGLFLKLVSWQIEGLDEPQGTIEREDPH